MSGDDAPLAWLFDLQRFGVEPGLETTKALLEAVGDPQESLEAVLVAGTNGKGSVTALLAACLAADGRRTGSFFSPHLERVGERAKVDGGESSREQMAAAVAVVRPHAERLGATFFEVMTVAALLRFRDAGVDWAVLEVGLGGRLDATNAVEPRLAVITTIGLDHQAYLGPDLRSIAGEKAGILRPGVPALTSATGEALDAIVERAGALSAPLVTLRRDLAVSLLRTDWDGIEIELAAAPGARLAFRDALPLRIGSPLLGAHQADNVALAAAAALRLGVVPGVVTAAIAATSWPGRLEVVEHRGRRVVLDGAHNPQAAAALRFALDELGAEVDALVIGVSADKDSGGVAGALAGSSPLVIATRAGHSPRALDPGALAATLRAHADKRTEVVEAHDLREAVELALRRTPAGGTIVVAGSLFLVGAVRTLLAGTRPEPGQRWQ